MRWSFLLALLLGLGAAGFVVATEAPVEDPVWWYTNQTPPRVALAGPAGPLRGQAEAALVVEPADRARVVGATVDGQPAVVSAGRVLVDSAALPDGPHRVVVAARDTSRRQNEASAEWTFTSDNSGPTFQVALEPADGPTEGKTLLIRITASEAASDVAGDLEGRVLRLQPDGSGGWWALEGIPPEPAYRQLNLQVRGADRLGNAGAWQQTYPLVRTRFPEETLDFDPRIDFLAEQAIRAEEMARLMPFYRAGAGGPKWNGRFLVPVPGPITTEFATRRSYNGRFPQGNHLGVDFGAPLGTPVRAPADGVVVFAAQTPVRGNVLIVDHGAGVFSTYAHLQRFESEPGQAVEAGQTIARVGSTGLSTGPHLHWEIWVDEAAVDPLEWTERTFP